MISDRGNAHTLTSLLALAGAQGLRLATCSLLLACAPAAAGDTARPEQGSGAASSATDVASEIPEVETFALVWFDARLHRAPQDDAPLQAYDFGSTSRSHHPGEVHVARVLERRGEWRRLGGVTRWLDAEHHSVHCIGSDIFAANGLDIAVWVHQRDLAPVLRARFERQFDDGTFVSLDPGTPVVEGGPWADGFLFPVEPAEAVGFEYVIGPGRAHDDEGSLFTLEPVTASLGGQPVAWSQPVWNYAEQPMARLTVVDGQFARLRSSKCGAFELAVQGSFEPLGPGGIFGATVGQTHAVQAGAVKAGAAAVVAGRHVRRGGLGRPHPRRSGAELRSADLYERTRGARVEDRALPRRARGGLRRDCADRGRQAGTSGVIERSRR